MKRAIENIGKKVLDFIFDFENNEYVLEQGFFEPENGINESPSLQINGFIEYAGHDVTIGVWAKDTNTVEVLFESDEYYNIEAAVNEYVQKNLDFKELMACAIDDRIESEADEWQRNGFRNADDFYSFVGYRKSA